MAKASKKLAIDAPTPQIVVADSLPYYDTAIDEDEDKRTMAMNLVDDELEKYSPERDYIEHLPDVHDRAFCTPNIRLEHARIENGIPVRSSDELSSFTVEEFSKISQDQLSEEQKQDYQHKLIKSINKLKIKMQYRQLQIDNLSLIEKNGNQALKSYIEQLDLTSKQIDTEIAELKRQTQEVHWKRKEKHEEIGRVLDILDAEWKNSLDKNSLLANELLKFRNAAGPKLD